MLMLFVQVSLCPELLNIYTIFLPILLLYPKLHNVSNKTTHITHALRGIQPVTGRSYTYHKHCTTCCMRHMQHSTAWQTTSYCNMMHAKQYYQYMTSAYAYGPLDVTGTSLGIDCDVLLATSNVPMTFEGPYAYADVIIVRLEYSCDV